MTHLTRAMTTAEAELNRLRREMRRRDLFLSAASNELRNPMHSLSLQLASVSAMAAVAGADQIVQRLQQMQGSLERYLNRAVILLDLARLDAGTYPLMHEDTDLVPVLLELVDACQGESRFHGMAISAELPACCIVKTDRLVLDQIVGNLLSNALKHSGGSQVALRLQRCAQGILSIEVQDDGQGITEADQARMRRLPEADCLTNGSAGFGLGLWMVRELSNAIGATVSLHSRAEQGTKFVLEIRPQLPPPQCGS